MREPLLVAKEIREEADRLSKLGVVASRGQRISVVNYIGSVSEEDRKHLVSWIFGRKIESFNELTDAEIIALKRWIGAKKVGEHWLPLESFKDECRVMSVWSRLSQEL